MTDLVNPNFSKLADSAGILGIRVETPEKYARHWIAQSLYDSRGDERSWR
jgi:thiamine pyrophosphate-dependent acetolactate synthase large subunit-like protein